VEKETNGRPEGLAAVLTHHASAHFPPRFGLFPFAFHGRGLVVLAALDFLHSSGLRSSDSSHPKKNNLQYLFRFQTSLTNGTASPLPNTQ
jgi:hypothetical protein